MTKTGEILDDDNDGDDDECKDGRRRTWEHLRAYLRQDGYGRVYSPLYEVSLCLFSKHSIQGLVSCAAGSQRVSYRAVAAVGSTTYGHAPVRFLPSGSAGLLLMDVVPQC